MDNKADPELEDSELQLEQGILKNATTFASVFERIFQKYGREFDEDEGGGKGINFENEEHFENILKSFNRPDKLASPLPNRARRDDSSSVEVTTKDLDPMLTVRLHEKVVQVKKEINWDEEESKLENPHIKNMTRQNEDLANEYDVSDYEEINSCSDTQESDCEDSVCLPPPSSECLCNMEKLFVPFGHDTICTHTAIEASVGTTGHTTQSVVNQDSDDDAVSDYEEINSCSEDNILNGINSTPHHHMSIPVLSNKKTPVHVRRIEDTSSQASTSLCVHSPGNSNVSMIYARNGCPCCTSQEVCTPTLSCSCMQSYPSSCHIPQHQPIQYYCSQSCSTSHQTVCGIGGSAHVYNYSNMHLGNCSPLRHDVPMRRGKRPHEEDPPSNPSTKRHCSE